MEMEDLAHELISKAEKLSANRTTWESHWEEVAQRVLPSYSGYFMSRWTTQGAKRTEYQYDSTASIALTRFAAACESMLTPRGSTWHHVRPSDPYLLKSRQVKLWFDEVNRLIFQYRYAPKANFASQNHENYMSLGAFGTGSMFVDELTKGVGQRYKAVHLAELFFAENHQGVIDTVYRIYKMTGRQMEQKWPDTCPKEILEKNKKDGELEYEIIHCVMPREDADYNRYDYKGMDIASYYVSKTGKAILSEGGYNTMPYSTSRYVTTPGELYGRSPAMMVLPAIKTLNEEKKTILRQGQRVVDPVLLTFDDGILDTFSLKAGSINAGGVTADGRPLVHTLPTGNLAIAKDMMDDERAIINDAFLVTLFQILIETPEMTATEVLERAREKGALLSPTMGRQQSEYLAPMIEREIDILSRARLLPPMPRELVEAKGDYQIQYDSPLSKMQRAEETSGTMRLFQQASEIAAQTQDPSPLDWFDVDVMMPELADNHAVPARFMRSIEAVLAIRKGRQQQMATQQMIDAGPAMASMMKNVQPT